MARTKKAIRPKAQPPPDHLRLCRVVPRLGEPWVGWLMKPEGSEMGLALRSPPGQDDYVIVRCVDAGGQPGLNPGADYLVLRPFVQGC